MRNGGHVSGPTRLVAGIAYGKAEEKLVEATTGRFSSVGYGSGISSEGGQGLPWLGDLALNGVKSGGTLLAGVGVLGALGKGARTGGLSAADANAPHVAVGNRPPYAADTRARDIVLQSDRVFVRVHGEGNQARSWMMRESEIQGLTARQIQDKFALPELPSFVSEVHVPAGTSVRVGTVGSQEGWGSGGGMQYELLQRLPESAFKNRRPLP